MSTQSRYHRGMTLRLLLAGAVGATAGLVLLAVPFDPVARVLVGLGVALLAYSLPLILLFVRLDEGETEEHFAQVDPSRSEIEALVLLAALSGLAAVGAMMVRGRTVPEAALCLLTVAAAWLAVHTTYTLRYAKHYLAAEPGCIELKGSDGRPRLSDFAYVAFNLGMTYQISDTDLSTPAIRRMVWGHTMLSYLFGTVIIASALNLLVSLAG